MKLATLRRERGDVRDSTSVSARGAFCAFHSLRFFPRIYRAPLSTTAVITVMFPRCMFAISSVAYLHFRYLTCCLLLINSAIRLRAIAFGKTECVYTSCQLLEYSLARRDISSATEIVTP